MTAKPSPASLSASTAASRNDSGLERRDVGEHAELVAAEPVGRSRRRRSTASSAVGEAREQRVAGRVAERVVVDLEAVEVEDREQPRLGVAPVRKRAIEVGDEPAAVAEPGQGVGDRVRRASGSRMRAFSRKVMPGADDHGDDRRARPGSPPGGSAAGSGRSVKIPRPISPQTSGVASSGRPSSSTSGPWPPAATPRRRAAASRPARARRGSCPRCSCRSRSGRGRCRRRARSPRAPAPISIQVRPGLPAGQREDADHGREQKDVAERVGEVDDDHAPCCRRCCGARPRRAPPRRAPRRRSPPSRRRARACARTRTAASGRAASGRRSRPGRTRGRRRPRRRGRAGRRRRRSRRGARQPPRRRRRR